MGTGSVLAVLGHWLVSLALALSSLVFVEPAPYDLVMPAAMAVLLMAGLRLPARTAPVIMLLALFLAGGFAAAPMAEHGATPSLKHFAITSYLSATAVFFAAYVAASPQASLERIFKAYCIAALIAALAALAAYGDIGGLLERLQLNERARGTFKDPNVLGPFLVAPALYAGYRALSARFPSSLVWGAFAALMAAAILVTFSRGAWGHFILSGAILIYFMIITAHDIRDRFRLVTLSIIAIALLAGLVMAVLALADIGDLLQQRASLTQSYDTGETGRFGRQIAALGLILDNPAGIGFGEFERIFPEAPHNVYLNAFIIAGWLGGMAYLGLVLITLTIGFAHCLRATPWQPYCLIVYATFAAMALEGMVIDSDHWRHFYLLTGLMWGIFCADWRIQSRPVARTTANSEY